jgi:hypothetical protein
MSLALTPQKACYRKWELAAGRWFLFCVELKTRLLTFGSSDDKYRLEPIPAWLLQKTAARQTGAKITAAAPVTVSETF